MSRHFRFTGKCVKCRRQQSWCIFLKTHLPENNDEIHVIICLRINKILFHKTRLLLKSYNQYCDYGEIK